MTSEATDRHRPLAGGVAIMPHTGEGARGTLTAVARRNLDGAKVLVTNLHVVSTDDYTVNVGDSIYQGGTEESDKVGQLFEYSNGVKSWLPVTSTGNNVGDLATLLLLPNVTAELGLHTHPIGSTAHRYVPIVAPYVTPERGMELTMFGAESGLGTVTVTLADLSRRIGRYTFDDVVVLDRTEHPGEHGDSGAPCVWQDPDGNYRMCCIVFAGREASSTDRSRINGFAVPASVAEHRLGIKFGVEAPTAKIATPARVYPGQWFQLNGSRSSVNEPRADPLKYLWEKVEVTAQPTPTQPVLPPIGPSTSPYHNFEAPTGLGTYTYKLTVIDSNGAKHSDRVSVEVVNRPTPTPTPTSNPGPPGNAAPPLPQEAPPTPSSSQWDVRYSSNKIQVKVTSLPTVNPAISEVRAYLEAGQPPNLTTVTEAIGTSLNSWVTVLSSSDSQWQTGNWVVHIRFENSNGNSAYSDGKSATVPTPVSPPRPRPTPETWGPWTDTGVREEDDTDVPRIIWKEQRRTSDRGNTETRWVRA